jgi:hypothetical protein
MQPTWSVQLLWTYEEVGRQMDRKVIKDVHKTSCYVHKATKSLFIVPRFEYLIQISKNPFNFPKSQCNINSCYISKYSLCLESSETETKWFADKPEISGQLQRCSATCPWQHSTLSPWVVGNREVVPPIWQCAAADSIICQRIFVSTLNRCIATHIIFSRLVTLHFFLLP